MDPVIILLGLVCTWSLVSGQSLTYGLKGHEVSLSPGVSETLDEILWRHKGNKVVEFYGYSQQEYGQFVNRVTLNWVSAELRISELTYEDSGEYELELFTYVNNRYTRYYFNLQVIDKVAKPNISCEMSNDLTNEKEATLNCSAESRQPQPLKYEWISDGAVQSGQTLKITLSGEHDDEEYTCRVSNPLTDATAKFTAKDCYPDEGVSVALIAGPSVGILIIICLVIFIKRLKQKPKNLKPKKIKIAGIVKDGIELFELLKQPNQDQGRPKDFNKKKTQSANQKPVVNNNMALNDPDENLTKDKERAKEEDGGGLLQGTKPSIEGSDNISSFGKGDADTDKPTDPIDSEQETKQVPSCELNVSVDLKSPASTEQPEPKKNTNEDGEEKPPPVTETKDSTDEHKSDKTGEENIENDQLR